VIAYERCNGAELYFEDEGEGTPVVFLPGVMTGVRFFAPQLAALSDDFRTVAFDYRSHGRSERRRRDTPCPSTPATCAPSSTGEIRTTSFW
jgi:pimeloyl-ACP methyl ester carboxylesterase